MRCPRREFTPLAHLVLIPLKVTYHVALSVPKGTLACQAAVLIRKARDANGKPLAVKAPISVLAHLDFYEEASLVPSSSRAKLSVGLTI